MAPGVLLKGQLAPGPPHEDKLFLTVLLLPFFRRQTEPLRHCSIFISQIVKDHIIKYKMQFASIILIKTDHLLLQPSCSAKYVWFFRS